MRTVMVVMLVAGIAMGLGWVFAADDAKLPTADEVLVKIDAKWAEMKSFEMDVKSTEDTGKAAESKTSTWHFAAERLDNEGKPVVKSVLVQKEIWKNPEGNVRTQESKWVLDGMYLWLECRNWDTKGVIVQKRDITKTISGFMFSGVQWGPWMLRGRIKDHNLQVVGEEIVDGKKMYVLDGDTDPDKDNGRLEHLKCWIGEDDLFVRRAVTTTDLGKGISRVKTDEFSNVKVDQKIDPKVFEYTPPAGAVVEDETKKEGK